MSDADQANPLPWDRRQEVGLLEAWLQTTVQLMFRPRVTFATPQSTGAFAEGLLYLGLAVLFAVVAVELPRLVWASIDSLALLMFAIGEVAFQLWKVPVALLGIVIAAAVDHVILRLAGVENPFAVTFRGAALSLAPCLIALLPKYGLYLLPIWVLVVRVFAYRGLHRIGTGKALLGALLVPTAVSALVGTIALKVYSVLHP